MSVSVTMPRLGESVSEGTVTRWLKKEGDRVEADEPLLEVSTDKVDTEIPAPTAGVISAIKVAEDETVDVGVELAVIDEGATAGVAAAAPAAATPEAPTAGEAGRPAEAQPAPGRPATAVTPPPSAVSAAPPAPAARHVEPGAPAPLPPVEGSSPRTAEVGPPPEAPGPPPEAGQPEAAGDGHAEGTYVTPLVRRLAAEHDVDLSTVAGTGVGGRIRKQDVLDAARNRGRVGEPSLEARAPAQAQPPTGAVAPAAGPDTRPSGPTPQIRQAAPVGATAPQVPLAVSAPVGAAPFTQVRGRTEKLSRLRTVIAQRMVESLQVSAQLTTVAEVDLTRIARLREQAKTSFEAREGVRLTFLPFFAVATCEALKAHPKLNASIDLEQGTITYHDAEHLGVAVDTDRGLLVPVIRNAGDLNLGGMARKIADLAERTRANQVSPDELGGGTFTLTNTGSRGALFDTPIINQPQVGILGTGTVVKRPAVVDDPRLGEVVAIRSVLYLALTYDHRIVDGADAARFLVDVKNRLEEGAFEADLGL